MLRGGGWTERVSNGVRLHHTRRRCLRRDCVPTRKAFNLGLPRTGTTWLHALLIQLGLRSLHCNNTPGGCGAVSQARLLRDVGAASQPSASDSVVALVAYL